MGRLPIRDIKKISKIVEEQGVEEARKRLIDNNYITQEEIDYNISHPSSDNVSDLDKFITGSKYNLEKVAENAGIGIKRGATELWNYIASQEMQRQKETADILKRAFEKNGIAINEDNPTWQSATNEELKDAYKNKIEEKVAKYDEEAQKNSQSISNPVMKKVSELAPSIGNMLPGTALSMANPVAGSAYFMGSAGGSYLTDARNKGASEKDALNYATALGIAEGASEMIGVGNLVKGTKSLGKGAVKEALMSYGSNIADNFLQEALMEPTQELVSETMLGQSDWDNIGARMIESGIDGALTALIMDGASAGIASSVNVIDKVINNKQVNTNEINEAIKEIQNTINRQEINYAPTAQNRELLIPEIQNNTTEEYIASLNNKVNEILPTANQVNTTIETLPTVQTGKYSNGNITLNANNLNIQTYGHELSHHLSQSRGYESYSDFVLTELDKSNQLQSIKDDIINTYQPIYEQEGRTLTDSDIEQEVVSRYTEKLFKDEESINKLLKTDRNVFQKIYDWVVDKIDYYKSVSSMSSEERQEYDNLRRAQKLFKKALESDSIPEIANDFQRNVESITISNQNILDTPNSNKKKQNLINLINSSKNIEQNYKNNIIEGINNINNLDENTYNSMLSQIEEIDNEYKNYNVSKINENLQKEDYDKSIVESAMELVPTNKQGKRTKQEWLKIAQQIGNNVRNKSQLQEYAEQSWKKLHPNIADNLNRQGQRYVKFTKEEWVNAVKSNNDTKYSIKVDKNNNKYVEIDTNQNIFAGKTTKEQIKIAHDYILNNFREKGLIKDNDSVKITRRTANEYTHPQKSLNGETYSSKLKASTELDNLLEISKYIKSEADDGRHIFAKNGWDYYETVFKVGNKKYSGLLNIANGDNGKLLYDITNIKERASNYSVKTVSVANSLSNHSITDSKTNVNTINNNSMQKDIKYSLESNNKSGSFFEQNKKKQFEIIQKNNPMEDDYHTGIRSVEDIKTLQETIEDSDWKDYDEYNPDLTRSDIENAIETGKIIVYSSYPIKQGVFVSPSYMEAESYSDNGKVYSKEVSINDVAWIDPTQGQFAKFNNSKYSIEKGQRKHYETVKNSNMVDKYGQDIANDLLKKERYIPLKNSKAIQNVENKLVKNGINNSYVEFKNKLNSNERMTVNDIAMGERLIQELSKTGDYDTVSDLIQDVAILGTELGQQVQAMSLINKMTPEGQLKLLDKTINRLNNTEKLDTEIKLSKDLREEILKADSKEKLDEAVSKATKEIAEQIPLKVSDKLRSWRYLSMLGNPRTHIRNILSNVAMKGTQGAKNKIAGVIEDIVTPTERTKTIKVASRETKQFALQDAEKMQSRLSDGGHEDIMSQVKISKKSFNNKVLNALSEFNSNMLEKEDWIFLKSAYKNSLANYMTANKLTADYLNSGSKEANIALEKAREYAISQAQEATFRQYSQLASDISRIENRNAVSKFVVGGALPFKKTPINIAKAGFEYSPIGLLKATKEFTYDIKKGNKTVNQAIDSLAKGLTGTSIMGIGMLLASQGILKSSGSDDEKEEKYSQSLGNQDYSIKIGNSTYTLDWLSPTAMPLFAGAELWNATQSDKEFNLNNLVDASLQTINPLMEMSMLQGVVSALTSYNANGTAGKLSDMVLNISESYAGQFIPTALGQIARTIDDTERDTSYSDKTGIAKELETFTNRMVAKLPIASMTLQPKTDIWGNEVKRSSNVLLRAGENILAPYYKKEITTSKVDKEIQRVYKETGEGVLPSIPNSKVTINKTAYKLSPEDYIQYKKTYGTTAKSSLNKIINTKEYKQLDDEEKAKVIQSVYSDSLANSKEKYADKKNLTYEKSSIDKKIDDLVNNGLSLVNSYIYKGEISKIEGTKNTDGKTLSGSTQGNKAKYIMQMNTTNEQKNKLLSLLNDSEKAKDVTVSDLDKIDKSSYNTFFGLSTTEDSKGNSQRDKYLMLRDLDIDCTELDSYMTQIGKIKSDKDEEGNTIKNSKLLKVYELVDSLDLEPLQKVTLLVKSGYTSDTENLMMQYMEALNLDTERKIEIMSMLYD